MINNSISILNRDECTGCSVCLKVCPHNAIEMIETKEGFHYPIINEEKCTNCGICIKKCHALNDNFKTDFKQEIYDVRADDEIRMKSSSGGMFTLLANCVLENNGYVCGASFTKDYLGIEHIIIDNKKDLDKLRGSKYIESNLGDTFIEIKKLLNDKKQVLFSGCPCQVSALYSYLEKDYDNLITVDLLCNSIVPQKVWKKYLKETFTDDEIKSIEYISFRDKEKFGWGLGIFFLIKDKEYVQKDSLYMKIFLEHIGVKEECLHCKYRKYERVGDISIGDYWGVKDNDNKGISLVLINTKKAEYILNVMNTSFIYKDVTSIKPSNGGLIGNVGIFSNRKYFFDNLDNESLKELYINSINTKHNVAIVNMMFQNNFGGVLTYYALFNVIKELGYNPILIYNKFLSNNLYDDVKGCRLALKYLNVGNEIFSNEELYKFVEKCDTFLVGSDQVWRHLFHGDKIFYYLLNFVNNSKKKISYSSSFGLNNYDGDNISKILFKYYISQFDYISVREDDAIDICKNEFNVNAVHVLDPVFLLDNKYYNYLIQKSKLQIEHNYIAVYSLYSDKELQETILYISNKLNIDIIFIDYNIDVEDFLYIIKNSDFLITDSFHGSCFAIIFNINFLVMRNQHGGVSRIHSLLKQFNLSDRIIYGENNNIIDNNLASINFKEINKKLELEKQKSLEWLINALETPKYIKEDSHKDDLINYLIDQNKELKQNFDKLIITHKISNNWIRFFGIYNTKNYIFIYLFGLKITIKVDEKSINKIAWWIPIRKWRDSFRCKFIN